MQIVVLADESLQEALLARGLGPEVDISWIRDYRSFPQYPEATAWMDLLFEKEAERLRVLDQNGPLVLINSVSHTLPETNPSFVRFNGWNSFLPSALVEASGAEQNRSKATAIFEQFNREVEWLPDHPGFITPRVVSMIIYEAVLAWKEGVSTREEIDTAMKLGTNYPYGPFEWAGKIGWDKVAGLLQKLGQPLGPLEGLFS